MKAAVNLDSKDVRAIVARFLGVPLEKVIPQRYGFAVVDVPASEIAVKIYGGEEVSEVRKY